MVGAIVISNCSKSNYFCGCHNHTVFFVREVVSKKLRHVCVCGHYFWAALGVGVIFAVTPIANEFL